MKALERSALLPAYRQVFRHGCSIGELTGCPLWFDFRAEKYNVGVNPTGVAAQIFRPAWKLRHFYVCVPNGNFCHIHWTENDQCRGLARLRKPDALNILQILKTARPVTTKLHLYGTDSNTYPIDCFIRSTTLGKIHQELTDTRFAELFT